MKTTVQTTDLLTHPVADTTFDENKLFNGQLLLMSLLLVLFGLYMIAIGIGAKVG